MSIIDDEYCDEVSRNYWAEEYEMKMGIHPTQIKERIESWMSKNNVSGEITFLDWEYCGHRVGVQIDKQFFGIFDYDKNIFESTPDDRFTEFLNNQQDL